MTVPLRWSDGVPAAGLTDETAPSGVDSTSRVRSYPSWPLVIGLTGILLWRVWYSNHAVMTHEAYVRMFSHRTTLSHIDEVFQLRQRAMGWAYLFTPIVTLVRLLVAASLLQLVLLAAGVTVGLHRCFFAVTVAFVAVVADAVARLIYLTRLGTAHLTAQAFSHAVGALLPAHGQGGGPLGLLHRLTVFDLAWVALATLVLLRSGTRFRLAMTSVTATWCALAFCEWSLVQLLMSLQP